MFANDLQILVWKIIACKPSFKAWANKQLKHQYGHKLHDQYYAAIAHIALQTSDHTESLTQFCSHLAWTFGSHSKSGKISSQATSIEAFWSVISEESWEPRLSKNSWECQNKTDQLASGISGLEAQNQKLTQLLEPKFLVNTITQAVASNLNISMGNKPHNTTNGLSCYSFKPYLEKPRSP